MVKTILESAGFILGETYKATRFLKPPTVTYAVYLDSYTTRGSDDQNRIKEHEYIIELYSYTPDPEAEERIESALDSVGIAYRKDPRYWLNEEQLYQVVYTFDHLEKIGG